MEPVLVVRLMPDLQIQVDCVSAATDAEIAVALRAMADLIENHKRQSAAMN